MPIISSQKAKAMRPRTRTTPVPATARVKLKTGRPKKPDWQEPRGPLPKLPSDAPAPPGVFDNDSYLLNKQMKEKHLGDRARIAAERESLELAARQGELVTLESAQTQLEREHTIWLNMVEEWRQAINKKLSKLGIPVEMQESISDMIMKETTIMRQKRAAAE